ncbi:FkbM family methyltransferase, partial [Daejeonella sp.]|uniref:FkbM family methyltransferase n=1 Tax=Daejeonella sp. TaxID=2805397 RepID=UPI0030BF1AC6
MFGIGRKFKSYFGNLSLSSTKRELSRINNQPLFTRDSTNIFGKPFKFNDGRSFHDTYLEIFQNNIYQFIPDKNRNTIIDCGANMGLSVLYFSQNYPDHQILAFEPDPAIFSILEENVKAFKLDNVILYNNAVWDKEDTLTFFTDNGMGGRVGNSYADQKPSLVKTVRLKD